MTERLSDDELRAAVEDFRAMIAGEPDAGYALTNVDVLRLLEELVAARGTSRQTGADVELEIELRFPEGEFEAAMSLLAQAGAQELAIQLVRIEMGDDDDDEF